MPPAPPARRHQQPEPTQRQTAPVERFEPREQITEPLQIVPNITVNLVAPAQEQQAPVVVVRSPTPAASAEKTYVYIPAERRETERFERQPRTKNVPEVVQPDNEKRPEIVPRQEQKNVPNQDEKNSSGIPETFGKQLFPERLNEPQPASRADAPDMEIIGPGRQRKYEEIGENDMEPIREMILYRFHLGRHWPGLSKDMEKYYEYFYFTKPSKKKDGKDYAKHIGCWKRRVKWIGDQA